MAKKVSKKHQSLATNPKYQGKYVIFGSSGSRDIVASGRNLGTVIEKARSQGVDVPAIVFVPKKDTTCIY